jgi:cytosine/adenosine deaminase-related metal-dependent hydrolase
MATINGAKAIGMDKEIGSLEAGKKADVIVINMRRPEWYPNFSEVQNLVYSASGDAVETVYIDGRLIMENRRVLTVNEGEIMDRCALLGTEVLKRSGVQVPSKWPIL